MILFHITCSHHLKNIYTDSFIKTTESNIGAPEIMNIEVHRKIAEAVNAEKNYHSDPPLVLVWNPNDPTEALTMPRDVLAKVEKARVNFKRLTQEEIDKEVGLNPETYKAKVVLDVQLDHTDKDGNVGDLIIDTPVSVLDMTPYGEHVGPDVVWLTRDITPKQAWAVPRTHNWEDHPVDYRKDAVLIAVEVPDEEVHKWTEWAFEQGINQKWYDSLAMGLDEHEDWYVVTRPVPIEEWIGVWDLNTGQCAWLPPGSLPEGCQDAQGVPHEEYTYLTPIPDSWVPTRLLNKSSLPKKQK